MKRLLLTAGVLLAAFITIHIRVTLGSRIHLDRAREHRASGEVLPAVMEYQTAIGYYAPLNPYSRRAAVELTSWADEMKREGSVTAFEVHDRARRSILGLRSFYQPYRDLLTNQNKTGSPRDPNLFLYIFSVVCLAVSWGAWWIRSLLCRWKISLSLTFLALWVVFLSLS
ncbi:MAG TPA: hypothetical protein PK014_05615 [Thermoanaerobaculia bacterium]|nr:hypothetical protein [Thermoanaerobaculia bacterium]HUM28698.1 hypothetical protein [Thermoanaerobaculia bacterium]HXK68053.1 hypothetical protein [Thermoanaerobaculia bacterium]